MWCIMTYIIAYVKTQKNKIHYPLDMVVLSVLDVGFLFYVCDCYYFKSTWLFLSFQFLWVDVVDGLHCSYLQLHFRLIYSFWMFPCVELVVIYFLSHFLVQGVGCSWLWLVFWLCVLLVCSVQPGHCLPLVSFVSCVVSSSIFLSCSASRGDHSMSPCMLPCSCSWWSDIFRNSASWSHSQLCLCCLVRRFLRLFHCVVWLWPLLVFLFFYVHPFPYVFIFWFWLLLCSLLLLGIVLVDVVVCDNVRK